MGIDPERPCIAFAGHECLAHGELLRVARAVKARVDRDPDATVLVLDAATSEIVELDLRGTPDDVEARILAAAVPDGAAPRPSAPRSPGRPKLGVVAREVTLLPRHWEWLAAQPGGASVTLRRLVENARLAGGDEQRVRRARDAAYRFMFAVAGDAPGFEEASRALYAGDGPRFLTLTEPWPLAVRDHARRLAQAAS